MNEKSIADWTWEEHQAWEREWWTNCVHTFGEETKQVTYANRMGLVNQPHWETWPLYRLNGKSVLDIGGGPVSMLLKTVGGGFLAVADPCTYPSWVMERYKTAGIEYFKVRGEDIMGSIAGGKFDEVWIYNVLQHTENPQQIAENAMQLGVTVRVFDWCYIPACAGHPQELRPELMTQWFGIGTVENFSGENGCHGTAFYGSFSR